MMKKLTTTFLLLLSALSAIALPQSDNAPFSGEIDELSWAIYQQIDFIEAHIPANSALWELEVKNPFQDLELPVTGYTTQGFPIFAMEGCGSLNGICELPQEEDFWQPKGATSFLRKTYLGGNILSFHYDFMGFDAVETQLPLAGQIVLTDTLGNEIFQIGSAKGGFHPPAWSTDERYVAITYGAETDQHTGLQIFDLEANEEIFHESGAAMQLVGAPVIKGSKVYTTVESWYEKSVTVWMYDTATAEFITTTFSREEFSYWSGYDEEGVLFTDCEGEEFVYKIVSNATASSL